MFSCSPTIIKVGIHLKSDCSFKFFENVGSQTKGHEELIWSFTLKRKEKKGLRVQQTCRGFQQHKILLNSVMFRSWLQSKSHLCGSLSDEILKAFKRTELRTLPTQNSLLPPSGEMSNYQNKIHAGRNKVLYNVQFLTARLFVKYFTNTFKKMPNNPHTSVL